MHVVRRLLIALLVAVAFFPIPARAQGLTGTLVGVVKDQDGGVVPGALVRITSPALIGGERQTT